MKATISSFRSTSTLNTDFLPLFLENLLFNLAHHKSPEKTFQTSPTTFISQVVTKLSL